MNTYKISLFIVLIWSLLLVSCNKFSNKSLADDEIYSRVDSLMNLMTLEEKVGQLNCLQGQYNTTAYESSYNLDDEIRQGRVGSITSAGDFDNRVKWQKMATQETRLKIPLLFNADVVHGYRTIFPVPIAQAASWDLEAIEEAEHISSMEAYSAGIHWTFAPMVDISRDPRWGRVMEGGGEDTYLGSQIAAARIKGIQKKIGEFGSLLACVKHFAAYGAPEGGKEYNTVDMSEIVLREVYLPPYKAGIDAGAVTIMNSFNVINRIPASCNDFLVNQILKKEWEFQGFTVSDAFSFYELIPHGMTTDSIEAARMCFEAGSDIDLWSRLYITYLPKLVKEGKISEKKIDQAVRRVLYSKFKLGLFDNPFINLNKEVMQKTLFKSEFTDKAREMARKTFVLLKNEKSILPLKKETKTIAVIGWNAISKENNNYIGTWSADAKTDDIVTLEQGIKKTVSSKTKVLVAQGCNAYGKCTPELTKEAVRTAQMADIVVLAIGEEGNMSGECASRAFIGLPNEQEELVKAIFQTGKPVVAVIFAGRPLTFEWTNTHIPAILYVWQPGTMGGLAIADVLFGDYSPSGKLPMTFPLTVGQVPMYYNQLNTGRPKADENDNRWGISKWSDVSDKPMYPFGFGLSYTTFEYSELTIDKQKISTNDTLKASITIKNTGDYHTDEIVQLYIQDIAADVVRPVKELKAFKKIQIKKGETKKVIFKITVADLMFWNRHNQYIFERGTFRLYIGSNSEKTLNTQFELL